jgi:PAS domain S-box-containing protein
MARARGSGQAAGAQHRADMTTKFEDALPGTRGQQDTAPALDTAFLRGGDEMTRLIAAFDWSTTPIGALAGWPAPMKVMVGFILRSPAPIVTLWGDEGVMIYNDAYRDFAGARHPALLGSKVLEGWHEVAAFNAHVMQKVYREGGTLSFESQELTLMRDGSPRKLWTDLSYSPALDDDGTPLGVVAIVQETTERVLHEKRRDEERRRLLQMAENSPSFMALLEGPEHRITTVNARYQQLIGERDVVGKTMAQALPDAVEQGFVDLLDTVYRSGQPFATKGLKYAVQPVPGGPVTEHFVEFVYQPLMDEDGKVTGIFVDGVDVTERTRAQAALGAASAQFHTFAQTMPMQIWTSPPGGQPDWFNDQVYHYSGLSERMLRAGGWSSLIHPDDRVAAGEGWARALASGETYETEFRLRRGDGVWHWHLVRALPIRDGDGRIIRWVGTNTDIHEQKRSQAESAADRDRMWAMSRDLMLVCTHGGIVTAVNPSWERILGWRQDEILGQDLTGFIHPDDVAATRAELEKLSLGITTLAFENRYRTRDGSYRTLAWSAVPDASRIHGVARDITQERALARDRERIWSLSPVLKAVTTADGQITDVNPRWSQVLGWSREETIGRRGEDFLLEEDGARARRLEDLAQGKSLPDYQLTMRAKDGSTRIVQWRTFPEDGTIFGFGRDVTAEVEAAAQLSEAEAALRQAQKMEAVGQLTGGIAHDFNNLLQGISGSLEIVQRRVTQGRFTDLDRFITGATTAATRAAALTHRLLAFSRRQPLDPRAVHANTLVASMEDLIRRTIGEGIALDLSLAPDLWVTRCDPNQLESAILNLAINARDAMPEGGQLGIETVNAHVDASLAAHHRGMKPGDYVCICVHDTGVGMDDATIARAFEPFFTTKPMGQGTGLGLSMIYGFAQQSLGYARIQSEPDKGTAFRLYLPRFTGPVEGDETTPETAEPPARETGEVVLVVEDEPVVRALIVGELAEQGYEVLEAADGPAGLAILQSRRAIDVLVTDIGMPGLNGRQMADAARLLRPRLPVLFMTGYAENAALASGFLEPGMAMITKPFAMEALAARVRVMLEE